MTEFQYTSESLKNFITSFIVFQQELEPVKKESDNPFFKSKYADLAAVDAVLRPLLVKHKFCYTQIPGYVNGQFCLITRLMHLSGEWIQNCIPIISKDANSPQAQGSSITYARRYGLQTITGLVAEDDDGNSASGRSYQDAPISRPPAPKIQPTPAPKVFLDDTPPPNEYYGDLADLDNHSDAAEASSIPPVGPETGERECAACGHELKLSKAGTSLYCPNFKDTTKGEHTRTPIRKR